MRSHGKRLVKNAWPRITNRIAEHIYQLQRASGHDVERTADDLAAAAVHLCSILQVHPFKSHTKTQEKACPMTTMSKSSVIQQSKSLVSSFSRSRPCPVHHRVAIQALTGSTTAHPLSVSGGYRSRRPVSHVQHQAYALGGHRTFFSLTDVARLLPNAESGEEEEPQVFHARKILPQV